jgi:Na+/H+ antiporter NhaC
MKPLVRLTKKLKSTFLGIKKSNIILAVGGILIFIVLSMIAKLNAQLTAAKSAQETKEIIEEISLLEELTSILQKILIFLIAILILCFYIDHQPLFNILIKSISMISLIYLAIDYADLTFKVGKARSEDLLTTGFKFSLVIAVFIYIGFSLYIVFNRDPIA